MGYGIPGRKYGWIAPDGTFKETGYADHDWWCYQNGLEPRVVEVDHVRVSSVITMGTLHGNVTDAQLATLLTMLERDEISETSLKAAANVYDWSV